MRFVEFVTAIQYKAMSFFWDKITLFIARKNIKLAMHMYDMAHEE